MGPVPVVGLSVRQLARRKGISERTVWADIAAGRLPVDRSSTRRVRIRLCHADRYRKRDENLLTTREAARLLDCSIRTVKRRLRDRTLPRVMRGSRVYIDADLPCLADGSSLAEYRARLERRVLASAPTDVELANRKHVWQSLPQRAGVDVIGELLTAREAAVYVGYEPRPDLPTRFDRQLKAFYAFCRRHRIRAFWHGRERRFLPSDIDAVCVRTDIRLEI